MTNEADGLPDFPVDNETLDLLLAALDAPADSDGKFMGIWGVLDMLAGIDPDDRSQLERIDDDIVYDPRPHYHEHDVVRALIAEVFRLRGGGS